LIDSERWRLVAEEDGRCIVSASWYWFDFMSSSSVGKGGNGHHGLFERTKRKYQNCDGRYESWTTTILGNFACMPSFS
jgi:hypothetical protein